MHKNDRQKVGCSLAVLSALFLSSLPAQAQVQTWVGGTSDAWSDSSNWSTGTGAGSDAVFINTSTPNPVVADGVVYPSTSTFTTLNIGSTAGSQGHLTLQNGSVFYAGTVSLASTEAGTGTLNIYDSQMTVSNVVQVGRFGHGNLTVSGSSASLVLTSSVSGYIQVGGFAGAVGSFVVSSGANVSARHVIVGNGRGSGEFIVDTGQVTLADDLTVVGQTGNTNVVVRNGGTISLAGNFDLGSFSNAYAGFLTITGAGSRITNTGTSTIGWDGKGIALISESAAYEAADMAIGYYSTGNGEALVTRNASIKADNTLAIGYSGSGILTLQEGGKASATTLSIATLTAVGEPQSQGILNIGGFVGSAAAAPGTVTANRVEFGTGQGAINFNHTATDYAFDATITDGIYGNGMLNAVAGRTILIKDHTGFTGTLEASTGIFQVNRDMSNATASILVGGMLEGIGRVGDTVNAGVISPGNSIGTLTIAGNYTGVAGSSVWIETVLGTDASQTDRLVIAGNTSGSSSIIVTNRGGVGAPTVEGIKIIEVGGASDAQFSLAADYITADGQRAVVGGAYAYTLHKNGISNPTDGDWYLRSGLETHRLHPVVPLYESYPQVLSALNGVSTLQQRVGNRYWSGQGNAYIGVTGAEKSSVDGRGMWARVEGSRSSFESAHSTSASSRDVDFWKAQTGLDLVLNESLDGSVLVGSLIAHYGQASADVKSVYGRGSIDTIGYGIGTALTWYGAKGFYVDGQIHDSWYDSDLKSQTTGRNQKNDGRGYAISIETGKRIAVGNDLSLTPQAQLVYSNVKFDSFTDSFNTRVLLDRGGSLRARLGLSLDKEASWIADGTTSRTHIYGIANLYNEFLNGSNVDISDVKFSTRDERLWGGVGLGGSHNWNNDKYSVYGKVNVSTSLQKFADSSETSGSLGFRVNW